MASTGHGTSAGSDMDREPGTRDGKTGTRDGASGTTGYDKPSTRDSKPGTHNDASGTTRYGKLAPGTESLVLGMVSLSLAPMIRVRLLAMTWTVSLELEMASLAPVTVLCIVRVYT